MQSTKNTGQTMVMPQVQESGGSYLHHIWASIAFTVTLGIVCCVAYPAIIYFLSQAIFPAQANGSLIKKDGTYTTKDEEAVGSALLGQNFSASGYFQPRPSAAGAGYDPTSSGGTNLGPLSDKLINGATNAATTQPTTQPESVGFDGLRFRAIQYAVNNGISFKLYTVKADGTRLEVPLSKYEDSQGNLNETAMIDAFPHPPGDGADKEPLIAADFSTPIPGDAVTASGSGLDPHISTDNAEIQKNRVAKARNITPDQVEAMIKDHTDQPSLGFLGDPGVNVLMLNLALDAKYPLPAPLATQPTTQPSGH